LSVVEMIRWVSRLLWPKYWSQEAVLKWSIWRREHQWVAQWHHYRKRAQRLEYLQL
jgi:hypothetical protein